MEKKVSLFWRGCLNNESADFSGSIAYCNEPVWWTCFSCLLWYGSGLQKNFQSGNYGRPRFFSIIFTLGIMALYEWLVGRKIVDRVAKFLCKVKTKLSKMLKKLNTCVFGKVKKIVTKMLKPLQKLYTLDKLKRVKKEKRKRKWQQKTEKYQQED